MNRFAEKLMDIQKIKIVNDNTKKRRKYENN